MFSIGCLENFEFLNNGVTLLILIDNFYTFLTSWGVFWYHFSYQAFYSWLAVLVNFEKKLPFNFREENTH